MMWGFQGFIDTVKIQVSIMVDHGYLEYFGDFDLVAAVAGFLIILNLRVHQMTFPITMI
jgi:hypothetical protein